MRWMQTSEHVIDMDLLLLLLFIIVPFYAFAYYLYSIQTVGGSALYGSPVTQFLFPGQRSLLPTWGYDGLGFAQQDTTKHGMDSFWPQSIPYVPSPSGSGGIHPQGGMREAGANPVVSLRDGYPDLPLIRDVYDRYAEIPSMIQQAVGWWGA